MRVLLNLTIIATLALAILPACSGPAIPTVIPKAIATPAAAPTPALTAGAKPAGDATVAPTTAAAAAPTTKIKRGGTLRTAQADPYDSLDPHLVAGGAQHVHEAVFDAPLYLQYDEAKKRFIVNPWVVEKWDYQGDTTVTFKVKSGIKFHDGSPLDAEALRFNFDRLANHKKSSGKDYVENIKDMSVVDPTTLKLTLKSPSGAFLSGLTGSAYSMWLVSKTAVEKLGDDQFNLNIVGSGPFQMVKYMPDNVVNLKRNDNYWRIGEDGKSLPYLDGIDARNIVNTSVQILEMRARTVDYADSLEPKDVQTIKSDPELVFFELDYAVLNIPLLGMNMQKLPFDKLEVRKAAQYALDRESISKSLGFGLTKAWYYPMWAPGVLGWDESILKYEYNPDKSKQLLTQAGYPGGLEVILNSVQRDAEQRAGQMVKAMWDAVGIRTTYDVVERVALFAKMRGLEFQAAQWRANNMNDPDGLWRRVTCDGSQNRSQFCDKEFDKCMLDGRRQTDDAQRNETYKKCLRIFQEGAYITTAYGIPANRVFHKSLKGVRYQFTLEDWSQAWLDK
jgi:peptide/nickel transport system substrate-binding protein